VKYVVFDIETDGLLDELTRLHSLVLRDVETGEMLSCTDSAHPGWYTGHYGGERVGLTRGLEVLMNAERVYGHNIIKFDIPALQKVYPWFKLNGRVCDTQVVAQMRWAYIGPADWDLVNAGKAPARLTNKAPFPGSHQLEAWGIRLGCFKGDYSVWCKEQGLDPWSEWRPEMQTYCEQDTEVTRALVLKIRGTEVSAESIETEHELAAYLAAQERNGWPFDMKKAVDLMGNLAARREELGQQLVAKFGSWEVTKWETFTPKRSNAAKGWTAGVPIRRSKTTLVQFNPKSNQHVERCLKEHYGWKPTKFTKTGQAEVTEETLEALEDIPEAKLLLEFLLVKNRLARLSEGKQAYMKHLYEDQRTGCTHIKHRVKQNHAVTHRASHVSAPIAGTPKVGKPYGAEFRELFCVPPGWVQVGADASGLELRCLAHFMAAWDKGAYGEVVLHGDIHTVNQKAAGLATRDQAKTFIYAYLYGEGPEACGAKFLSKTATSEQKRRKGLAVQRQFTAGLPALGKLQDAVKNKLPKHGGPGFLLMPDGRRTYIRHEHAALNSLLQSAGAIICKRWIVHFNRKLVSEFGEQGWTGQWAALGWIHDEVQLAVRPEISERVKEILVESIREITQHYKWRIPLDGEAKCGANWRETH
jgi:hypothetical protein